MSKGLPILIVALAGLTGLSHWASVVGMGAPKPEKKPVSIREGSVRHGTGRMRTRYFVGGGILAGK